MAGLMSLGALVAAAAVLAPQGVEAAEPSPASGPASGPVSGAVSSPEPSGATPTASVPVAPAPMAWPSGDELRRELQLIGYSFRVDRATGEWIGWAPTFPLDRPPSLRLGVEGHRPAWAAFQIDLLAVEARAIDVDATLTALLEVMARLPFPSAQASGLFEFVTTDLVTSAPEELEACAATRLREGVIVIRVDPETGLASLLLAPTADARQPEADIEGCVPIRPTSLGPPPGELVSERLTVVATDAADPAFEPSEPTVEGSLVTVVLTFRNGSEAEQTLTFGEPVNADSGPVAPGEERLMVVRRLEPGDYPFFSATDPTGMTGVLRVVPPPEPSPEPAEEP